MTSISTIDMRLPGADLIRAGLEDLNNGRDTVAAMLVSIGEPRLRRLGIVPAHVINEPERRLFEALAADDSDSAHSHYNALIRRLVSFERAAECAP
jgi:hypothetical protein